MSEYYLVKEPEEDQSRKIHRDNCSELPATPAFDATLKYLGSYGNKDAAVSKARGYYDAVTPCANCMG